MANESSVAPLATSSGTPATAARTFFSVSTSTAEPGSLPRHENRVGQAPLHQVLRLAGDVTVRREAPSA